MQYKVVKKEAKHIGNAIESLEREVKILLHTGWKLQGGISISVEPKDDFSNKADYYVAQAMVKED